jgi:hypothetical protein
LKKKLAIKGFCIQKTKDSLAPKHSKGMIANYRPNIPGRYGKIISLIPCYKIRCLKKRPLLLVLLFFFFSSSVFDFFFVLLACFLFVFSFYWLDALNEATIFLAFRFPCGELGKKLNLN